MGEWLNAIRIEPLTYFFKGVTFLGNEAFLYALLPILYWCWKKREGLYLFILVIVSAYINYMIKRLLAWERPPSELWLINAGGFTFPSTHAALVVVLWGYLAYEIRKRWFTISAISLMVLMAFSRVYLGVHYPQDVIAGLAIGTLYLLTYRWTINWILSTTLKLNEIVKGLVAIIISILMLLAKSNVLIATATGMFAGLLVGHLLEPHFADFDTTNKWYVKLLKASTGMLIALAIWQGLEWILPMNPSFKWFQFFILGIWVSAGAPWLFIQLRLARREL